MRRQDRAAARAAERPHDVLFGFLLAAASTIGWAVLDGIRKRLGRDLEPAAAVAALLGIQSCVLFAISALQPAPELDRTFFGVAALSASVNIVANLLYMRAVQISPLSLTIPYLAFTPALLLITGWVFIGEIPGPAGIAGVLTVTLGAYLLNRGDGSPGWLEPFRALSRERGSVMMLIVASLWGLTASFDKIGVRHGSPAFYAAVVDGMIALPIGTYLVIRRRDALKKIAAVPGWLALGGVIGGLALWGQFESLQWLLVAYTISIKRSGLLLSVLIGHFVFAEGNLRSRMLGAIVIVAGLLLIVLGPE